jgi:hypothetical protein
MSTRKLAKLAQLENGGAGIMPEVTLGQRPKLHQLGVMHAQEREIARLQHRSPNRRLAIYWSFNGGMQLILEIPRRQRLCCASFSVAPSGHPSFEVKQRSTEGEFV